MNAQMLLCRRLLFGVSFPVLGLVLASCGSSPPDDILQRSSAALVFVKEPSQRNNGSGPMESNIDEYYPGTDLYLLSPISSQGELTNLTAQYTTAGQSDPRRYGAAVDPEVSHDGRKVLFSMKKNSGDRWHIYEMNADGSNLNPLTDQTGSDDMDPTYLPNGQIMFTSTRSGIVDEYERRSSPLLHVGDRGANGRLTNIRQVSFNQSHDTNPIVHSSGKIFYSRWEHLGDPNKFPLFVMNPDGTRPFVLYGNHSPRESGSRVFLEQRELSDGGIVCSVMERNSPFEGGAIAIIDISKSDDNLTFITPATVPFNNTNLPTSALFKTPHPIIDRNVERIIVSMSPIPISGMGEEEVDYGLYVMNKDGNNVQLIYNDPAYNEYDAVPVMPRENLPGGVPAIIPTDPNVAAAIAAGVQTGMFFDGNVYDRATTDGQTRPSSAFVNDDGSVGQAKYLRILEAIPLPRSSNMRGGPIGNTNFEKQRVVGYAPIRSDGSFSADVPANKSLHMQTLDQYGMMLVNQLTWVQVMPGERRLCTGCHDSHDRDRIINDLEIMSSMQVRNRATGSTYNSGFNNADVVTAHPAAPAPTDTMDFFDRYRPNRTNTIQAIFESRCQSCHGLSNPGGPAGGLSLENLTIDRTPPPPNSNMSATTSVYDSLMDGRYRTATNQMIDHVSPYGARRSPLMWAMYGRQLNSSSNTDYRPLSYDHTQLWTRDQYNRIDPFLPANKPLLNIIEWLDAGSQYSNTIAR
ncbi:MAG: alpha protein [Bacteroidetes bacterium]|nr:alpha protein [Bacteroidota bacterium]